MPIRDELARMFRNPYRASANHWLVLACGAAAAVASAQQPAARGTAPIDLTGYWVSVVTEDWLWRMRTPPKGDYASVPLNAAGRGEADRFDPAADDGSCRPFGAPALLRMPTRVRITWENDSTLKLETDNGMQTRLLHFGEPPSGTAPSRQGTSRAEWSGSSLKVETTELAPGYLRRNGVPYSADAAVTEHFVRHAAFGDEWFTVTTVVRDPRYLAEDFITSSSFKKLPGATGGSPSACEER